MATLNRCVEGLAAVRQVSEARTTPHTVQVLSSFINSSELTPYSIAVITVGTWNIGGRGGTVCSPVGLPFVKDMKKKLLTSTLYRHTIDVNYTKIRTLYRKKTIMQ